MSDSRPGSDFNLDHLANLARLALTPEEKARFATQLGDVITYISQLKEADISGVEATAHAYPLFNVLADDVARPGLTVEAALRNAPEQRDNMIVVPKVVE
jgi:aspartyl-tRNA(Asn)/glutamyl-tRNA(Gln) amidotransferase subunit C